MGRIENVLRLILGCFAFVFVATADPIGVSYSITGSPGSWTLDFSVSNNETGTDQAIYLFGVLLSAPGVTSSPAAYDSTVYPTWTNSALGGSSLLYNNVWLDASASNLLPGQTLAGFDVQDADALAPQSVPWFAISTGDIPYMGSGSFGDQYNPGFEGAAATPEPGTSMLLAGAAFLLLAMKWAHRPRRCRITL